MPWSTVALYLSMWSITTLMDFTCWSLHEWLPLWKVQWRISSSLLQSSSVNCIKVSVLITLLSVLTAVSSEECVCAWPVLVSSLFWRQVKAEQCQPASIQLLFSYWYSGHTKPSRVSVARAKEECGKWGDGEKRRRGVRRRGVRAPPPMLSGPKNRPHPPFFLFPMHLCFHTQPPPCFSLCFPHLFLLISLFGLSKHAIWCPMIRLLKCNARLCRQCSQTFFDEGLTIEVI